MSLIVLGTVALDNIKTADGEKCKLLGGSASHFSMSARLFNKVHIVAAVGHDFPQEHIRLFKRKGVDISSVIQGQGKTFQWSGEYRRGDYNSAITLNTELGILADYSPKVSSAQRKISNVFLANFDPDNQMRFLELMDNPEFVGLDSMNLWIDNNRKSLLKLIKRVGLFVANDGEARALTGESNLIKAARHLRKLGPEMVVVKKGEHGVIFCSDKFMFIFPAYPVEHVVDPTGAGDTFAGGLMGYLSKAKKINEKVLKKAILYATILASFNVEGFGHAKTAPLTLTAVHNRMKKFIKIIAI